MDGVGLLSLPIAPGVALEHIIAPALARMPQRMNSTAARVMLLAIALQESGLRTRVQTRSGPARGLWQFEARGGVRGVLRDTETSAMARELCEAACVEPEQGAVHRALVDDDRLACQFARLLLWADPEPLPVSEVPAWEYYLRTWRPGRPRPSKWSANWRAARDAVLGDAA